VQQLCRIARALVFLFDLFVLAGLQCGAVSVNLNRSRSSCCA
jgi:hypothetical protein